MSNEATVQSSLTIRKSNLNYMGVGNPTFQPDVSGTNGPTPGAISVPSSGVTVTLAQLTAMGGLCEMSNVSTTETVEYGVIVGGVFRPFGEIKPGEKYVVRLSRNLQYGASGTAHVQDLRLRSLGSTCIVIVNAFDP